MGFISQIKHLCLGKDGQLSSDEALSTVCLLGFTAQVIMCLVNQSWDEHNLLGLATLGGYTIGNKIVNKAGGKGKGNGNSGGVNSEG